MRSRIARYDGHAEWYDETFSVRLNEEEESFLRECLGAGHGEICLDVPAGPGATDVFWRTRAIAPSGSTSLLISFDSHGAGLAIYEQITALTLG